MKQRQRLVHYGPERAFPFRTLCGAGRSTTSGLRQWRSVFISHARADVTCQRCERELLAQLSAAVEPPAKTRTSKQYNTLDDAAAAWLRRAQRDGSLGQQLATRGAVVRVPARTLNATGLWAWEVVE